ncbi:MAG: triosephosphate isomerase [bacterium]|nr:MAG: triosephosphate isomerase [bacterium]
MRVPLIVGNWKMHKDCAGTTDFIKKIAGLTSGLSGVDVLVAPPFTSLFAARDAIGSSSIGLCAQNVHWEDKGAFTGEISSGMLRDAGCGWVIIGHSERRQYFGETDETVNKRLKAALKAGLKAIVCVGETLSEREAGKTESVVERQLDGGLEDVGISGSGGIVIAYEPVWAIGTGKTATSRQAQEVHAFIRGRLASRHDGGGSGDVKILYGGSVKPENAAELIGLPDVDGALVGGASLIAEDFSAIIRASVKI